MWCYWYDVNLTVNRSFYSLFFLRTARNTEICRCNTAELQRVRPPGTVRLCVDTLTCSAAYKHGSGLFGPGLFTLLSARHDFNKLRCWCVALSFSLSLSPRCTLTNRNLRHRLIQSIPVGTIVIRSVPFWYWVTIPSPSCEDVALQLTYSVSFVSFIAWMLSRDVFFPSFYFMKDLRYLCHSSAVAFRSCCQVISMLWFQF